VAVIGKTSTRLRRSPAAEKSDLGGVSWIGAVAAPDCPVVADPPADPAYTRDGLRLDQRPGFQIELPPPTTVPP
jgi:hypothetical protein